MLERHDPSRVLCGHCGRERSSSPCRGCGKQVCDGCARDAASCPTPRSFEVRLGLGARLRSIAIGGGLGLVSTLSRRIWILDTLGRRRLGTDDWSARWNKSMVDVGGLSSTGSILWPRTYSHQYTQQLRVTSVGIDARSIQVMPPVAAMRFDRSESGLIGSTIDERILVVPDDGEPAVHALLGRKVIQAYDGDLESGVIAAATHGEIGALRIGVDQPMQRETAAGEDSRWVGVAGESIALITSRLAPPMSYVPPSYHRISVLEISDGAIAPVYSATHGAGAAIQTPCVADLSDDGRFVAVALANREIAVHDVDTGGVQRFDDHTDRIASIRFGPQASFLVSGDFDNRVIVRFREGDHFAVDLEGLEIDEPG